MRVVGTDGQGNEFQLAAHDGRWIEPDDSWLLDLTGLVCLPGLVDAHAHLSADTLDVTTVADAEEIVRRGAGAVRLGVTAAVDKGWDDDLVLEMVRDGRLTAPRVQAAGRMIRPADGYWEGFGALADGDDLIELVGALAPDRAWVKIVADWPRRGKGALPNYTEDVLVAAVEVAHAAGARVAVHTMAPDVPGMAVRAGVDSVEHGLFLTAADLESLEQRDGMWVPTVLRMEQVLAEMKPGSSGAELLGRGLDNVRRLLPLAAEIGVSVLTGSDLAVSVGEVGREVQALVRFGLPAESAVSGATQTAYRALDLEGGLRPGAVADLTAYARSPFSDPAVLTEPMVVVFDGELAVDRRPG